MIGAAPTKVTPEPSSPEVARPVWPLALVVLGAAALFLAGLTARTGEQFGLVLAVSATALAGVVIGLKNPLIAALYLLVATFFRLAIPVGPLPVDLFIITFAGLLASVALWVRAQKIHHVRLGLLELCVGLYIVWNIGSMLAPHRYPPIYPLDGSTLSVPRFILIGTVMPMTALVLGRVVFPTARAVQVFCLGVMAFAAFSVYVSVAQFYAPAFLWPGYIRESDWPDRAVGVPNQPVVNGLILILGYLVSVLVVSDRAQRIWIRVVAGLLVAGTSYAIFLTRTRAVWLAFALAIVMGIVLARGWRRPFVVTASLAAAAIAANWSSFASSDREAGGVGSTNELYDRLNIIATALWAVAQKPAAGWGIGRFPAVNTYHHQQFSPSIPWEHGYGIASHLDILGVAAELGLMGVALWLAVMGLVLTGLVRAVRSLPRTGVHNRDFAVLALLALCAWLTTGLTVDLRFFDFPNLVVLLLSGIALGRLEHVPRAAERGGT